MLGGRIAEAEAVLCDCSEPCGRQPQTFGGNFQLSSKLSISRQHNCVTVEVAPLRKCGAPVAPDDRLHASNQMLATDDIQTNCPTPDDGVSQCPDGHCDSFDLEKCTKGRPSRGHQYLTLSPIDSHQPNCCRHKLFQSHKVGTECLGSNALLLSDLSTGTGSNLDRTSAKAAMPHEKTLREVHVFRKHEHQWLDSRNARQALEIYQMEHSSEEASWRECFPLFA